MDNDHELDRALAESLEQFARRHRLELNIRVENAQEIQQMAIYDIISSMGATIEGGIVIVDANTIRFTISSENADLDLDIVGQHAQEFLRPVEPPAPPPVLRRNDSNPGEQIATIDISSLGEHIEAFGPDIIEALGNRYVSCCMMIRE